MHTFKEEMYDLANALINTKKATEHAKDFYYLSQIDKVTNQNNSDYAYQLHKQIEEEYSKEMDDFCAFQATLPTNSSNGTNQGKISIFEQLRTDMFVILYSALLKEGRVSGIKECLKGTNDM